MCQSTRLVSQYWLKTHERGLACARYFLQNILSKECKRWHLVKPIKRRFNFYKDNRDLCFNEYITKNRSTYDLADEWGLSKSTVYSIMKYHGLIGSAVKDTKTTSDEDKFNVENPIFCYLAGLISADGYISDQYHRVQLRLVVECRDILDKLAAYFNISNGVKL